jgi:hypothetical protein
MHYSATAARYAFGKTFSHVPLLLAALFLLGGLLAAMPIEAAETGIRGTVLWGPVQPGPAHAGQADEAPFRASFHVLGSGSKVAGFDSDEEGNFEVRLPLASTRSSPTNPHPLPLPNDRSKQ